MAETYFPFDAGAGASTTEDGWAKMARLWYRSGVLRAELSDLAVTAPGSGMTVNVAAGRAFIEGFFYENDATKAITITAAHATNPRIDRIVARLDRTANTITAMVITGTPAATPAAPVALASSTQWDVTLATVLVGAAVVIVASDKVTDLRSYAAPVVDRLDLRSSVDTPSDVGLRRIGAGSAQVDGALTVSTTLHAVGAATFDAAASVTGSLTASSTLRSVGAATLDSTLSVAGAATLSSTLRAVGAATMDSTLSVGAKLTVAAGGVDVAGSPSGYSAEIRFTPNTGGGYAISTIDTGSPEMAFHHRGAGNTGSWTWKNGSSAASTRLTLSAAGLLSLTGGADVAGSPSGYGGGELRFPGAAAISTLDTGATEMRFDHRAASNTGSWRFSNGTGAGSSRFLIGATGDVQAQGDDHYFGRSAFGATGSRLHVEASAAFARLNAENEAGGFLELYLRGSTTYTQDAAGNNMAVVSPLTSLSNGDTALTLTWISPTGTTRTKQMRVSAAGEVDGTSRRYCYLVDA